MREPTDRARGRGCKWVVNGGYAGVFKNWYKVFKSQIVYNIRYCILGYLMTKIMGYGINSCLGKK